MQNEEFKKLVEKTSENLIDSLDDPKLIKGVIALKKRIIKQLDETSTEKKEESITKKKEENSPKKTITDEDHVVKASIKETTDSFRTLLKKGKL